MMMTAKHRSNIYATKSEYLIAEANFKSYILMQNAEKYKKQMIQKIT